MQNPSSTTTTRWSEIDHNSLYCNKICSQEAVQLLVGGLYYLFPDRREGRWSYYTLERSAFLEVGELLAGLKPKAARTYRTSCC